MRSLALGLALALACAGAKTAPPPPPPAPARSTPAPEPVVDRSKVPEPGPAPALKVPPQRHFQLSNGLRVRLVEYRKLPIVALHLVVDAGDVHDPANRPGLASFTASMLTEGTKGRSATKISDDLGFLGASLSAGAAFDSASLSGSALVRNLDGLLELFADVLVNPTFPQGDFARVQDQRLVSLVQQRDVPGAVAAKAFAQLYWGDHPYGHWLLGTEASVSATTRDDLVRFHRARWRPDVSELVVVGDVTEPELQKKLEGALARWTGKAPPAAKLPTPRPPTLRTVLIPKRGAAPQTFLMMGMPGFARASPDYAAGEVAYEVLGGGSSSRLFRELRERLGYTYGTYARGETRKIAGTSFVAGNIKADVTGAALKALLEQVSDLRERPVPSEELAVARNALLLSLPASFASAAGIAGKLAEEVVYGLPDDYWDGYAAQVAKVGPDDVQAAAKKYLDTEKITTVMVCDPEAVRPQLSGLPLGPIEVRPPPNGKGATRRPRPVPTPPASPGQAPTAAGSGG